MHYASCAGIYEVIQFLMDRSGDCTVKDHDGLTPLHYAVRYHVENEQNLPPTQVEEDSFIDIVMLLIMMGKSDINSVDENKCSVLHDAAKYQSIEIIDYLIKIGANIYALDKNGHSPKYYSLKRNDEKELMEYWKEIYLNSDVYHEIMMKHNYKGFGQPHYDENGECQYEYAYQDDDEEQEYDGSLSNINQLEAFKSIVTDEQEHDDRRNVMNEHEMINR
eukprot:CAMPEP_0201594432 /NCGR_PEP_ID=MMETSP0190_2-20130828/191753_1 /ASSEMBLY_ACC=CAM_ASM_000263 /TAXON_ID=37353 /ORGANISM="Rosalina sp." /LENGTH=219 /DNA_ID=CAMNT_0048054045 /DNA_START=222 /DNA_END=881 /DNA_ORIENTATION=+